MSRRNPSPTEILVQLPWQVSAVLAPLSFIVLRWILPAIGTENTIFKVFIQVGAQVSWLPPLLLSAIAVISFFVARKKRALLDTQKDASSLRALSWKEFEWMVGEAYRHQGYNVEEQLGGGADGGIDLTIRKGGGTWLVQCKQWKVQAVSVKVVREMFGLVNHHQASGAIVITTGRFTRESISFAEGKTLELIDGPALLQLVKGVQGNQVPTASSSSVALSVKPPASPIATPSCPKCGGGMVERTARKGGNAGNTFWGCTSYPTCRGVRNA